MPHRRSFTLESAILAASTLFLTLPSFAQPSYARMAPLADYLISNRNAEIELARSAAPSSISRDAKILVLTSKGYETAATGSNNFVCLVLRSWASATDDPEFWNAKVRAPICLDPAAARTVLPHILKKTEWALAGLSKDQIAAKLKLALRTGQLAPPAPGAMGYMMSNAAYLFDADPHWRPHLMFFLPTTDAARWGANLPGSPIFASQNPNERLTIFYVPVGRWSDDSLAPPPDR